MAVSNNKTRKILGSERMEESSCQSRKWENLDIDLLNKIYSYIPISELSSNVCSVCKSWQLGCWEFLFWRKNMLDLSLAMPFIGNLDSGTERSLVNRDIIREWFMHVDVKLMKLLKSLMNGKDAHGLSLEYWRSSIKDIFIPKDLDISDELLLYLAESTNNFFPSASVTSSGRPVLLQNEVECNLLSNVDLEPDDNSNPNFFPPLKSGLLILTTHRLLWLSSSASAAANSNSTSTAAAVPLSAITHILSSKRSIKSVFHSPRFRFQVSVTGDNRVGEPGPDSVPGRNTGSKSVVITAVVRGKGDWEVFVAKLWECWKGRAWEVTSEKVGGTGSGLSSSSSSGTGPGRGGLYGSDGSVRMVGVAGILRREQEKWESTDKSMQEAFQDLNALMSKAKEMVMLAEKMKQKLLSGSNSHTGSTNEEEVGSKEDMQELLLSVGIISPVTKESAGALYHQQLSRQLADFVKIPLERAGGMINLIDIYCLFNRARGTALISPDDLLQACSLWEKFDVPVMLRKFDSGVMVIQNKSHSDEEVFARIKALVTKPEALQAGISASDAAMALGIAPAMAKEHLLTAESRGLLCRDISPDGFHFYFNLFPEIVLDDLYLVKEHGIYSTWVKVAAVSG
ncbi:vacuolar protein sorting-associated protein 36 [Pistacia vera]|uniref:vacuolar protein sorting-associated protein 36 n=1 Tax=Pistacia vera TaxID=55513 RepID=UPI00126301DE|nr:vacuolar protein sorting-associated protein 36 [Pistacia vera]